MKYPPLIDMEPLPPVPSPSRSSDSELSDDLNDDDDDDLDDDNDVLTREDAFELIETNLEPELKEEIEPEHQSSTSTIAGSSYETNRSNFIFKAEEFAKRIWAAGWNIVHHKHLPAWLKDNTFIIKGHRAPTNSYLKCFSSIFRVHSETGNIWTHLLACVAFIGMAVYFNSRSTLEIQWQEKAIFSVYFVSAIICYFFSFTFHTVFCHSDNVGKFFNKLDYCGIAVLTMGSFVPWLYYAFYCRLAPKIVYLTTIFILGTTCIIVSMWDKFREPKFRPIRAGLFIGLGLCGVIPAMHCVITDGFWNAIHNASLGWLVLMGFLYISGAVIYAVRIPERIWPGRFDIWCQSHQIFHVFAMAAALVHYHGLAMMAKYTLSLGECMKDRVELASLPTV